MEKKLLLTREAAKLLRVSDEYLRSLIRNKKIAAYKEGRRGGYRIPAQEIDKYIARRYNEKPIDKRCYTFPISMESASGKCVIWPRGEPRL